MSLLFRFYPYIAGVLILIAAVIWIWMRGYHACEDKAALATIKEEKTHVQIEQKVNAIPDSALDRALSRWVRKS